MSDAGNAVVPDAVSDMAPITEELLRKRSEHNDGELSTLKEITLHQFDIEKIENLDVYCRNLEILYLQNNLISKIENLGKLKCLRYLNLALNNIMVLENLEPCESLEKLDLTVNFIWNPMDLNSLEKNYMLRELFLLGNPVAKIESFREYAIIKLPQLTALDGKEIEKSDRISARQSFDSHDIRMRNLTLEPVNINVARKPEDVQSDSKIDDQIDDLRQLQEEFNSVPVPHTPASRLQAAKDVQKMKGCAKFTSKSPPVKDDNDGDFDENSHHRILQKNEGKWKFWFTDSAEACILNVEISKFLDSSFIDVEVHSTWLRISIKGKVLQLVLDNPVRQNEIICERSHLSGHLMVTMIKEDFAGSISARDYLDEWKRKNSDVKIKSGSLLKVEVQNKVVKRLGLGDVVAPRKSVGVTTVNILPLDIDTEDFTDDPAIPPLV